VTVTSGLMLLVYAMTRASTDGWTAPGTIGLIAASAALVGAFALIELRSHAPLLPPRIFRIRTLSGANATMALVGAVTFSEFFVLTLYVQEGLGYSPVRTGLAFAAFALTVVVMSNVAQALVTRVGVRNILLIGLTATAVSVALLTRMPVDGHYFWDLFPAFVLGGAGLGMAFVPLTIASLTGVAPADAGVASGLVNTTRQIGGAIGIAIASSIATSSTRSYLETHAAGPAALDHGLQVALYAILGLTIAAIAIAALTVRPQRRPSVAEHASREDEAYAVVGEAA
jgi:MFS family permease